MENWYDIVIQAIGFLGVLFFFISFQVKTNKGLFVMQTLGCLTYESIAIISIVISVIRFGWKSLDGDKIEK